MISDYNRMILRLLTAILYCVYYGRTIPKNAMVERVMEDAIQWNKDDWSKGNKNDPF